MSYVDTRASGQACPQPQFLLKRTEYRATSISNVEKVVNRLCHDFNGSVSKMFDWHEGKTKI